MVHDLRESPNREFSADPNYIHAFSIADSDYNRKLEFSRR